jgi:arginyl-tRNA synthetase
MVTQKLNNELSKLIKDTFDLDIIPDQVQFIPVEEQFGDFGTSVAFQLAGRLKKNPREIARSLADSFESEFVDKIEIAGAGYLNITLKPEFWQGVVADIDENYAKNGLGNGKKVQVEFISANPTGPTTIGNARGGFIGDVLSSVLAQSGYQVTREYYFNNAGTQISKLLESVKMQAGLIDETDERQYRGDYIEKIADKFNEELSSKSDEELGALITTYILKEYIEPAVESMGITFDEWFNEKTVLEDGSFDATIEKLKALDLVFERDGAVWLNTGKLGDEREERVIIKSNGDPTYMAPDIAYHANIFGKRDFDYAIKVLGPDHIAQFPSVKAAVMALYPDKELRMASYQWLRLMKEGKEVKVSKRLGQFVTVQDLVKQVGVGVARMLILMRSANSPMDFDLDLATQQSNENPYYYVMYSYARAHSLLKKAKEAGLEPASEPDALDEHDIRLIKAINQLPGVLPEIAEDYQVHRLAFMAHQWAQAFHDYYESAKIVDLPREEAETKLLIIKKYQVALGVLLGILGIEPVESM